MNLPELHSLSAMKMKSEESYLPEVSTDWSRRPSFASSYSSHEIHVSSAPSAGTTSPATPITSVQFVPVPGHSERKGGLAGLDPDTMPYDLLSPAFEHEPAYWPLPSSAETIPTSVTSTYGASISDPFISHTEDVYHRAMCQPSSNPMVNPPLSRPIFAAEQPAEPMFHSSMSHGWEVQPTFSPQSTIAPSEAYHTILAPSPVFRETSNLPTTVSPPRTILLNTAFRQSLTSTPLGLRAPITPLKSSRDPSILTSSPSFIFSPRIVPSQLEVDEEYQLRSHKHIELSFEDLAVVRRTTSTRLTRRPNCKKTSRITARSSRSIGGKSGIDCLIIPENNFGCKYKDCGKKFRRQEHKKRHERSVHEKDQQHRCWVPECKTGPFTRTDNLKSHLKKTHGRMTQGVRRNRYVATQDDTNEFYNPDWVGPLTKEGYPIFDARHPCFDR